MSTYGLRSLSLLERGPIQEMGSPFIRRRQLRKVTMIVPSRQGKSRFFPLRSEEHEPPTLHCFVRLQGMSYCGKCGKCELYAKIAIRLHSNVSSRAATAPLMTINLCDLANWGMEESSLAYSPFCPGIHIRLRSVGRSVRSKEIGAMNGE